MRFLIERSGLGSLKVFLSAGITGFILLISTLFLISLIHFSAIADLQY